MTTLGQLEINNCQFTWKIENFSKQGSKVGDVLESPIVQMNNLQGFRWQLRLYPYGQDESSQGFLSLFLRNHSQVELDISFELTLFDVNGFLIRRSETKQNFNSMRGRGWPKLIERDTVLQGEAGLKDDVLNCTCIIDMDVYHSAQAQIDKQILNKYESLYYNENFSDLTVIVKRNHLKVHKSILSAGSPVFKAMLSHNMKEKNTNTIKITDVNYNIMKEVLLFMYSGKISDLNKDAKALLPVADKYEIEELKELCEINLWKNIKIEDACDTLKTAALYNCYELRIKVIEYIVENIKEINDTAEFKGLNRSNPELFEEIMSLIVKEKC